jgi:hypothetical protein
VCMCYLLIWIDGHATWQVFSCLMTELMYYITLLSHCINVLHHPFAAATRQSTRSPSIIFCKSLADCPLCNMSGLHVRFASLHRHFA